MKSTGRDADPPPVTGERIAALLDTLNVLLVAAGERRRAQGTKAPRPVRSSGHTGSHRHRRHSRLAASDEAFVEALVAAAVDGETVVNEEAKVECVAKDAASNSGTSASPSDGSTDGESDATSGQTIYRRIRRGERPKPRGQRQPRRRRRTPRAPKPKMVKARVSSYFEAEEIDGTGYVLVLRLNSDRIMAHRRGHFEFWRRPKIEVRDNKTSEYRESYSCYCGRQPKLKNWLHYI